MSESELMKIISMKANLDSDKFCLSIDEDKKIVSAWNNAKLKKGVLIGRRGVIAIDIDRMIKELYDPEWKFEVLDPPEV